MAFGNQYGIDLAGIGNALDQREANSLRKLLTDKQIAQIDRETESDNALGSLYRPQLEASGIDPAVAAKIGGKGAQTYITNQDALRKAKFDRLQKEAPIVKQLFSGIQDANGYASALAEARRLGIEGVEKMPMRYDPAMVQMLVRNATAIVGPVKQEIKETANGFAAFNPETLEVTPIQGAQPYRAPDNTLVEIYDPNSPTGGKMVPRAQAVGQPAAMGSGMRIESDGQGGFKIVQGKGASTGFDKPTINKIDEMLVGNTARIGRLLDINQSFKPEFLTFGGQIKNWGASMLEKLDPSLVNPQTKQQLAEYTTFRQRAYDDLNQTLKEMSGAAITPQEAERLLKVLGDPAEDSPTQFKAKLDDVTRNVRLAQARLMYLRKEGPEGAAKIAKIGLQEMPGIIRKRETELLREAKAANPQADENALRRIVKPALQQEFGI